MQPRSQWPLACLLKSDEGNTAGVFVHPRYGTTHWSEWADQPPTWMDPHLLVDMARSDPEMKSLLDRAFKKNDVAAYKQIQVCLQRIFEEEYLPWMIGEFLEHALNPVAEWLTNSHVSKVLRSPKRKRGSKKKGKPA
jgi:hypothetical protein